MTLLDEIKAKVPEEQLHGPARNDGAIAAAVSVGRKRPSGRRVGFGTVVEVLGVSRGAIFRSTLKSIPDMEFAVDLLRDGELDVGNPLVSQAIIQFVAGGVLTQAEADALLALGWVDDPVSATQVADALAGAFDHLYTQG